MCSFNGFRFVSFSILLCIVEYLFSKFWKYSFLRVLSSARNVAEVLVVFQGTFCVNFKIVLVYAWLFLQSLFTNIYMTSNDNDYVTTHGKNMLELLQMYKL